MSRDNKAVAKPQHTHTHTYKEAYLLKKERIKLIIS